MDKFVIINKQNITQNLDENITNEQEIHQKELEDNEMIRLQDNNDVQFCNTTNLDNELQNNLKENENNETTHSAEESFRIDYFLYIVDKAISSIENRFQQFQIYEDIFGFQFNFTKLKSLDDDSL